MQLATANPLGTFDAPPGQQFWRRVVDVGLASIIFAAPLFMGGRHPIGQLVFVALAAATACAWGLHQTLRRRGCWTRSGAEPLIIVAALLIAFQLLPLPEAWLARCSPAISTRLPMWTRHAESGYDLGPWSLVSLAPEETKNGFVVFLAYALVFLLVVQRVNTLDDVERLLRWIACAAVAVAVLGLVQYLVGNGKFLWIYAHPFREAGGAAKGPFANENHFAHFLAIGLGPLAACGLQLKKTDRRRQQRNANTHHCADSRGRAVQTASLCALAIVVFSGILSFSRGGVLVMGVVGAVALSVFAWYRLLPGKTVAAIAAVGSLVAAALVVHGFGPLARQIETLHIGSVEELDRSLGRAAIWRANLATIAEFPLVGTGLGSHRHVYPIHFDRYSPVEYSHAENGYLQVLLELGIPGLALLLGGIGLALWWCVASLRGAASPREIAAAGAILAAVAGSLFHSLVDFVWYIPACMTPTLILIACACRMSSLSRRSPIEVQQQGTPGFAGRPSAAVEGAGAVGKQPAPRPHIRASIRTSLLPAKKLELPRRNWILSTVALAVTAVLLVGQLVPAAAASVHWDRYLARSLAAGGQREETDPCQLVLTSVDSAQAANTDELLADLERVLDCAPRDARANMRMAQLCLQKFHHEQQTADNVMDVTQIRDAALASRFTSRDELDRWLRVAVGENRAYLDRALRHALHALYLCPMQHEGYILLAELGFLLGQDARQKKACIEQALLVRPHSGSVLLAAASNATLAGERLRAADYWTRAFHQDPRSRARVIALLARDTPAEIFLAGFQPNNEGLRQLYVFYRHVGQEDKAKYVAERYVLAVERLAAEQDSPQAAVLWEEARALHGFLGNRERAVQCALQVLQWTPHDYQQHQWLGEQLITLNRYDEATRYLQWCLRRRPGDPQLEELLVTARRLRPKERVAAGPPDVHPH